MPLVHRKAPGKTLSLAMRPLGWGGAVPANSGEAGDAPGRVGAQGDAYAHLGLVCARSWSGGATGGGARRRPAVAAVVASAPVRGAHGLANKRALGLEWEAGKVLGVCWPAMKGSGTELVQAAAMAGDSGMAHARGTSGV
jgi:hypothetical protein